MENLFAALRFTEDPNLADNVYWYLCDFPVKEGDRVLAPVGAHNGLQFARVERVTAGTEQSAPYDMRLIKRIAAKFGARRFPLDCARNCRELGGVRTDGKRFTRFGAFLRSDFPAYMREKDAETLQSYGVTALIDLREEKERQKGETAQNFFSVCSCPMAAEGFDYLTFSESAGLRSALRICARTDGCVLFGCTAGKDRTGVLAAFLLLCAGVRAESVTEDFFLSERFVGETKGEQRKQAFSDFLQAVHRTGVAEYLRGLGLCDSETERIKQKLIGYYGR